MTDSPDPFLTYPRAVVGVLLCAVIFEIFRDRRSVASRWVLAACCISVLMPLVLVATGYRTSGLARDSSSALVCVAALCLAQGNISQYLVLKRSRKRGGVSLPMHLLLYGKDFAGMMFGLQLGVSAWSIVLMHGLNLVMRAPIIVAYLRIGAPSTWSESEGDDSGGYSQ